MPIEDPDETLGHLDAFLEDLRAYQGVLGYHEYFDEANKERSLLNQNYGVVQDRPSGVAGATGCVLEWAELPSLRDSSVTRIRSG